jgi:hypothetical protein
MLQRIVPLRRGAELRRRAGGWALRSLAVARRAAWRDRGRDGAGGVGFGNSGVGGCTSSRIQLTRAHESALVSFNP